MQPEPSPNLTPIEVELFLKNLNRTTTEVQPFSKKNIEMESQTSE